MKEWDDIRQDTRAEVILVIKNGREEEVWPSTTEEDGDGPYMVGEDGALQNFEREGIESEEEFKRVMPEEEHFNFIIRRSFHNTLQTRKSDQRENIFQTKCRIK